MTTVAKLGIAFRQWQREWQNYEETGKNKPVSYDEFIAPFLEMERQELKDAYLQGIENYDPTFKK
jgi:hypothetical protein